jgi:hypothetical protein
MRFLSGGVFLAAIKRVGRVQLVPMPGEADPEGEFAGVHIRSLRLENMELRAGDCGEFGGFGKRQVGIPEREVGGQSRGTEEEEGESLEEGFHECGERAEPGWLGETLGCVTSL